jgi:hypothetical protein
MFSVLLPGSTVMVSEYGNHPFPGYLTTTVWAPSDTLSITTGVSSNPPCPSTLTRAPGGNDLTINLAAMSFEVKIKTAIAITEIKKYSFRAIIKPPLKYVKMVC